jgi:hypothetical protein
LLVVDADVIPFKEAVIKLIAKADQSDEDLFEFQCDVYDFSFGGWRQAGNHLYRVGSLELAIPLIPKPGESFRPETATIKRMADKGHRWCELNIKFGIHDFEQNPVDYFRKAILFRKKFYVYLPILKYSWRKKLNKHYGYRFLLDGVMFEGSIKTEDYLNASSLIEQVGALPILESLNESTFDNLSPDNYKNTIEFCCFKILAKIRKYIYG